MWYLGALVAAVILNFLLPRLIPGNPVDVIVSQLGRGGLSSDAQQRIYADFTREFGLDKPMWQQFITYVVAIFHGDLGKSFANHPTPVNSLIGQALPPAPAASAGLRQPDEPGTPEGPRPARRPCWRGAGRPRPQPRLWRASSPQRAAPEGMRLRARSTRVDPASGAGHTAAGCSSPSRGTGFGVWLPRQPASGSAAPPAASAVVR